jgi:hypothetical protein
MREPDPLSSSFRGIYESQLKLLCDSISAPSEERRSSLEAEALRSQLGMHGLASIAERNTLC